MMKIELYLSGRTLYYRLDNFLWLEIWRLIKFFIIGGFGMLLNLGLLYFFTEFCGLYYMLSAIIVSSITITYNYFANHFWSFSDRNNDLTSGFAKFVIVMLMYFVVYQSLLYLLTELVFKSMSFYFVKEYMISSLVATGLATVPKYFLCLTWIWKKKELSNETII